MFGIGLPELILIMAVALIVVGPEKLPELAKGLAKQLIELKKAANVLKESLREDEPETKDWDRDLPIGFSRPEELAEAGRKAGAIKPDSGSPGDESAHTPDNAGPSSGQADIEFHNPADPAGIEPDDKVAPAETAEKEK